jgi:peptidoglycan hydrolase CwlO-like protein
MKKITLSIMALMMSMSFIPTQLKAETNATSIEKSKTVESAEAKVLLNRLTEIKAMDKSKMTSSEKKQLRKEVRTLKTNLAQLNGGVYLSVGAIIVILLLLILLL